MKMKGHARGDIMAKHQAFVWGLLVACSICFLLYLPASHENEKACFMPLSRASPRYPSRQAMTIRHARARPARSVATANISTAGSQAMLSGLSVSPSTGDETTNFTFRVMYSDPANESPVSVELDLAFSPSGQDGEKDYTFSMDQEPSPCMDFVAGCYYNCTVRFDPGKVVYFASSWMTQDQEISTRPANLTVNMGAGYIREGVIAVSIFVGIIVGLSIFCEIYDRKIKKKHPVHQPSPQATAFVPWYLRGANNPLTMAGQPAGTTAGQAGASNQGREKPHEPVVACTNPAIPRSAFVPAPIITPARGRLEEFITPLVDSSILAGLETWDEMDFDLPAIANTLATNDITGDGYLPLSADGKRLAPKTLLTYIDAAMLNHLVQETGTIDRIDGTPAASSGGKLLLGQANEKPRKLVPLQGLVGQHHAKQRRGEAKGRSTCPSQ